MRRADSFALIYKGVWAYARIGALVFSLVTLGIVTSACAQDGGSSRRPTDVSQRLIAPLVAGIAYDPAGERVFASLCRVRLYDCDLAEISMRGGGSLSYVRDRGELGYTQPAVSEDGRYLFAARAPRVQRPGQRRVAQELVRIDLNSGTESVVSPSSEFRYERLIALDGTNIMAVQSFRSEDGVRCRGDSCTDAARVMLLAEGREYVLPDVGTVSEVGRASVSIIPLGAGGAWIRAATGGGEYTGNVQARTMSTWLFDARTTQLSVPTSNVNVERQLFEAFANSRTGDVHWRSAQLLSGGGPIELQPFPRNRDTVGGVEQVTLTPRGRRVRLTKRRDGGSVRFDVELVENHGASPWQSVQRISVTYAARN